MLKYLEFMGKNKYLKYAHISERKFKQVLKEFCLDSTAQEASLRTGISRPTVNKIYMAIRKRIYKLATEEEKEIFADEVEIDESYFGAKRIRGKRGCGAKGKIPVFGILKRDGKVYTRIVKKLLQSPIRACFKGESA